MVPRALAIVLTAATLLVGCVPEPANRPSPSGGGGIVSPPPTPIPTPAGPTPSPSFVRPTPTPQPTFLIYTVVGGDSLTSIAKRFGTTPQSIAYWNRVNHQSLDPDCRPIGRTCSRSVGPSGSSRIRSSTPRTCRRCHRAADQLSCRKGGRTPKRRREGGRPAASGRIRTKPRQVISVPRPLGRARGFTICRAMSHPRISGRIDRIEIDIARHFAITRPGVTLTLAGV